MVVPRTVGGGRVYVLPDHPPYRGTRVHIEADWIEPYLGAERVTAHLNHLARRHGMMRDPQQPCPGQVPHRSKADAGERQPAEFQKRTTVWVAHLASWAAR